MLFRLRKPLHPNNRPSRLSGFTLLELLIAITLLGFILTLLFSAFRLAQQSWDSAERHMDQNNQTLAGRAFLTNLLTQAYPFRWKKSPTQKFAFAGDAEHLNLVAELPPFLGGGLQQAFLEVAADDKEPEKFRLLFRYAPLRQDAPDFDVEGLSEERAIIGSANKISFSYYGRDPANPSPLPDAPLQWYPEWREARHMPLLVRIEIDSEPLWPDIYAAPAISQEGGCRWDDFYKRCR